MQIRAHTTTPKGQRPNAEKRLVLNRNKTEQLETEPSKKMYGLKLNFRNIETEYHRMSVFCFTLFEIRETRFNFFL